MNFEFLESGFILSCSSLENFVSTPFSVRNQNNNGDGLETVAGAKKPIFTQKDKYIKLSPTIVRSDLDHPLEQAQSLTHLDCTSKPLSPRESLETLESTEAERLFFWVGWGKPERSSRVIREFEERSCGEQSSSGSEHGFWVYAPHFFSDDPLPWWYFPFCKRVSLAELMAFLEDSQKAPDKEADLASENMGPKYSPPAWAWGRHLAEEKVHFYQAFDRIQEAIEKKTVNKVVPVVFDSASIDQPLEGGSVAQLLSQLLQATRGFPLMPYGLWNQGKGVLGATPEILFDQRGGSASVDFMALAGTAKKPVVPGSLLNDPKERKEHNWVLQGILESLEGVVPLLEEALSGTSSGSFEEEVSFGKTVEWELPTLVHLMTPLHWHTKHSVKETSLRCFEDLVQRLHPTPALGGYPQEEALAILRDLELQRMEPLTSGLSQKNRMPRARFGAPFGVWSLAQGMRCVVGIRNLQWSEDQVRIGAGCGIVRESQKEKEWNELNAKMQSVKALFGLS